MNSYQKLKHIINNLQNENRRLRSEIRELVINPNSQKSVMVQIRETTNRRIDNQLVAGDSTIYDCRPMAIILDDKPIGGFSEW